jgi:SAM-dependent methyltransferase
VSDVDVENTEPARAEVAHYVERAEPVWDLHVGQVLVPKMPVPDAGATALVTGCRTGLSVLQLARMMPELRRVVAVDEDRELLNQAHATVEDVDAPPIFFNTQATRSLTFADDVFQLAVCASGVHDAASLLNALSALERVVAPDGVIGLAAFGAGSFPLVRELLLEELWARQDDRAHDLDAMWVTPSAVRDAGVRCRLSFLDDGASRVPVECGTVQDLLRHPLVIRDLREPLRPLFSDVESLWDALVVRGSGWFGDAPVTDEVELLWSLWIVQPPLHAVDEADVVAQDAAASSSGLGEASSSES